MTLALRFTRPPLPTLLLALLGACTLEKGTSSSTGETAEGSSSSTDDGATEPSSGSTNDGATEPSSSSTGDTGGSDTTGAPVEPSAQCAAQVAKAGCEALKFEPADLTPACVWLNWTPVTLVNDVCSFGAEQGTCVTIYAGSEGCAQFESCGKLTAGLWKQEGDQVSLAFGSVCLEPVEGSLCMPLNPGDEVAPECACLCDPGFLP